MKKKQKNSKVPATKQQRIAMWVKIAVWTFFAIIALLAIFSEDLFNIKLIDMEMSPFEFIKTNYTVLIRSAVIIILFLAASKLLHAITSRIIRARKGLTVIRLADSLMKYVIIIVMILMLLSAWGVDTTTLLASAGILGLIIGLGAQSLISDIISGLFIVFENIYKIGDLVEIEGFRGEVLEIGVRTTKLMDVGGNVKTVNNRLISSVVNLTQQLSVALCDIEIGHGEPLESVEKVISENIGDIKDKVAAIEEGPTYLGVHKITNNGVILRFIAKCQERDKFQTERDLNRHIKLIFDRNDIRVPYTQVTVHKPAETDG